MKSVLISIQPKWCELIASGKKTVEVRKTRPKIDVPFKCYIYCTLSGSNEFFKEDCGGDIAEWNRSKMALKKGKVIGEFVCKCVTSLKADNIVQAYYNNTQTTCLTDTEIKDYANGSKLYYWHISNLVIYDEPKELSEFRYYNPTIKFENGYPIPTHEIKRPPQSWCYVEKGGVE